MGTVAIVRQVGEELAGCELSFVAREPIDVARAQAQHAAYGAALMSLGCELMESHQIRRVPVVDDQGAVVGIVSLADVVRSANTSTTVAVVKEVSSGVERS